MPERITGTRTPTEKGAGHKPAGAKADADRAPRGTRLLVTSIMTALADIPEFNRKAAFKHASAAVKTKLIQQAERAKLASRKAGPARGAKQAAAAAAIRGDGGETRRSSRSKRADA